MNSREHIIYLMSTNFYSYAKNIISFRINGVMKPYFYLKDKTEFEQLKLESNKLRPKPVTLDQMVKDFVKKEIHKK